MIRKAGGGRGIRISWRLGRIFLAVLFIFGILSDNVAWAYEVVKLSATLPSGRYGTSAAAGLDGKIYIFGGYNGSYLSDILCFDPATGQITKLSANLPSGRHFTSAATGPDGKIYIFGGNNGSFLSDILCFDPATGQITKLSVTLPSKREGTSAARGPDGKIYIFGGYNGSYLSDILYFDPATGQITKLSVTLPSGRGYTSAATGPDGKIYIFGGSTYVGALVYFSDILCFDPATGQITKLSVTFPSKREGTSAARGPDGKIYIFGGYNGSYLSDILYFDPATGQITKLSVTLPSGRGYTSAATGSDGKIYIFGGYNGNYLADIVSFTVSTSPAPPTGLSATATSPTQVLLTWQPNTEPDLAGYIIYRNNTEIARVDKNTTTYTDSGLTPRTNYTYGIKAYNTSGLTSEMSNTVTVTTPKPPAPTNLTVSNITSTGATVTWDPVQEAESYNVYLNDFLYAAYVTDTSYNITGLDPATNYTVRVTAVISNVEGDPATTSFTTYDQSAPVPPAPPSGFTAQATGPTQVRLNWNPNTEPDLAGYIIYRNNTEIARVDKNTTTYTDSGLTPRATYTYGIKAYNTSNLTSDMRTVQVTTPKPPAPTNLTVSNVTSTGATVTWDPVSGAESYNVYINDFLYDAYLTQTQCEITGLDPATSYTVRVTAVISNVEGDPATTTFTTLVGYKPKLTVRVDNRQIIMSWESIANSFIVEANGQQITTTSDKQYTYTAEPGTYEVRVIAVVNGEQYPSDPVTVTVSALNTPGVVQAAKDILGNTAAVIFPFGGLIALGLALKASPLIIAAVKSGMLARWFRGW
ncbi:Kelch repeat-containing protein [Desulfofundulus salinus]|uniref:Fibronectin type-III domain-containing protein n=1 Tax=Desulfofundulus salinus TaxID=2419843 RepID=A0A494X1T5_9FIRM|nr:kelch repeat-containing protein [Desulfofundulus salinum]RKO67157.1 hypothetical protein D7024_09475 [Desulfofundulus salinum]